MNEPSKFPPYFSLGINLAVGMGFFVFCGYWLDKKNSTQPWWTLAGTFLGLGYCFYEIWKVIRNNE